MSHTHYCLFYYRHLISSVNFITCNDVPLLSLYDNKKLKLYNHYKKIFSGVLIYATVSIAHDMIIT